MILFRGVFLTIGQFPATSRAVTIIRFILFVGVLIPNLIFAGDEVSIEDRKAVWSQTPRGLTNSKSGGTRSPAPEAKAPAFDYGSMNKSFNEAMTKSSEGFLKSLPKAETEPDYLKELEKARQKLTVQPTGDVGAPELTQITDGIIASIQQLAELQKQYYLIQASAKIKAQQVAEQPAAPQQVKPLAAGLMGNSDNTRTPSPATLRTKVSEQPGLSRGLFPSHLESLSLKAYNRPQ